MAPRFSIRPVSLGILALLLVITSPSQAQNPAPRWLHLGDSHVEIGIVPHVFLSLLDSGKTFQRWYFPYALSPSYYTPDVAWSLRGNWHSASARESRFATTTGIFQKGFQLHSKAGKWKATCDTLSIWYRGEAPVIRGKHCSLRTQPLHEQLTLLEIVCQKQTTLRLKKTNTLFLRMAPEVAPLNEPAYFQCGLSGGKWTGFFANPTLFHVDLRSLAITHLVISLGTNDAYDAALDTTAWKLQFRQFMADLRREHPRLTVYLTTPPLTFYRDTEGPHIACIRREIVAAQDTCIHVFDLYQEMAQKPDIWQQPGIYAPDRLHFTERGYSMQTRALWDFIQIQSK